MRTAVAVLVLHVVLLLGAFLPRSLSAQPATFRSDSISGQLVFVPYYLAVGETYTEVTLRNAGPSGAFAFRLDEGRNNKIVWSRPVDPTEQEAFSSIVGALGVSRGNFVLYLEANASLTFRIEESGSRRVLRTVSQSGDACTVPTISATGVELLNGQWSGGFADNLGTEAERAREGTMFFIPVATFVPGPVSDDIANGNCASLNARWTSSGTFNQPPLFGSAQTNADIVNLRASAEVVIVNPLWRARVPVAYVLDFYTDTASPGSLHPAPGTSDPDLRFASHGNAQVRVQTPIGTTEVYPFGVARPDTFGLYLQTFRTFVNLYSLGISNAFNAASDVLIVSQPLRHYYADRPTSADAPYTLSSRAPGYAGEPMIACITPPLPANQPICPSGAIGLVAPLRLRNAVSAVRLVNPNATALPPAFPALASESLEVPISYPMTINGPASAIGLDFGPATGIVGGTNRFIRGPSGTEYVGLPAYVFLLRRQFSDAATRAVIATPGEVIANPRGRSGDRSGTAVDAAGGFIAVGAPDANQGRGEIYVFAAPAPTAAGVARSTAAAPSRNLVLVAVLSDTTSAAGDRLGAALSISPSGARIAAGAPGANGGIGRVAVFVRTGATWTTTTTASATLPAPTGGNVLVRGFGSALAIDDSGTLVVGAPASNVSGVANAGHAAVFEPAGASYGAPQQVLLAPTAQTDARFGNALALGSNRITIGAPGQDDNGRVFVFRGAFGKAHSRALEMLAPVPTSHGKGAGSKFSFGAALAMQGNMTVVAAPGDDTAAGIDSGSATVFVDDGTASVPVSLLVPNAQAADGVGTSVALDDGIVVLGAATADRGTATDVGSAFVFELPELMPMASGTMLPTIGSSAELAPASSESQQRFGSDVVVLDGSIVIGAPGRTVITATAQIPSQGETETHVLDRVHRSGFE